MAEVGRTSLTFTKFVACLNLLTFPEQGKVEGRVLFGGQKPSVQFLRHYTGYVQQFGGLIRDGWLSSALDGLPVDLVREKYVHNVLSQE